MTIVDNVEPVSETVAPDALFEMLYQGLMEISQAPDVQHVLQLITTFVQASGWRVATASLRERSRFGVTHLASTGLTPDEHETILRTAQDGSVWYTRMGPSFEKYRHEDWYYLPFDDPEVQKMDIQGIVSPQRREDASGWHPRDLLYLPLRDRDAEPIGLIVLDDPLDGARPTSERMRPVQLFARNAALILENQRLRSQSERHLAVTRVVQETAALISATFNVRDIVRYLVDQLVTRFNYPFVVVLLREAGRFMLAGKHGYPDSTRMEYVDAGQGVVGRAVRTRATQWVPNVARDPDYIQGIPEVTSEIAVPMLRGGEVLGLINVESTSARPLTPDDREFLETLGEQLTTAIVNARLFNETQQHALHLEAANEVSRHVTSILNIDDLLSEVVHLIRRTFDYYHVHIFMRDDGSGDWVMRQGSGEATERMKANRHARAKEEGIVGQAGSTGCSILVPNVATEPRHVYNPFLPRTRSELSIPLRLGPQVLGVLDVQSDRAYGLTERDQAIMETLGNQIAVALNNAILFSELEAELAVREALYRASYAISVASDPRSVLDGIVGLLAVPSIIRAGLLVPQPHGREGGIGLLEVVAVWNPTDEPIRVPVGTMLDAETMPALYRMATDKVQVIDDTLHDPRLDPAMRTFLQQLDARALALVPLRRPERAVGWLLLLSARSHLFTTALLQPYQTLADQAALALERILLLEQAQERSVRLGALNALSASIISSLELQQTLDESVQAMARLFGVRQSGLLLFDEGIKQGRLVAQYRADGTTYEREIVLPLEGNPLNDQLLATRAPVFIADVSRDPLAVTIRQGVYPLTYTALLVIPLLTRDRVIGSISLDVLAGEDRKFDPEEIELAQTMAAQIAVAIENARLYQQATQRAHDQETASQIGQSLTRVPTEQTMLRDVVHLLAERFGFYFVAIYVRDSEQSGRLNLREGSGALGRALRARRHVLWIGQGLPGHLLQFGGEAIVASDVAREPRYLRQMLLPNTVAEAAFPLAVGGELLGVLDIHSDRPGDFEADPLRVAVLSSIADQIAIALQNARLFGNQRETVSRLQEVDRLKSDFLASMSHELRTPLNSIIGFSKILLRGIDGPLTELQQQDVTSIFNSGQHLLSLINDILDLSKIAAGRMELDLRPLELAEVCEELLRTVEPQVAEKSLRLESQYEEGLPPARADRIRLRQVLLNLLSNAIKFTEQGGVFLAVRRVATARPSEGRRECVGDREGTFIEVAVRDTGVGIKPDEQELVFEEFRQVSGSARRAGGTGLGLAISRRFVELHGGALWVESRFGSGSTFRFTLPVVPAAHAVAAGEVAPLVGAARVEEWQIENRE